MSGALYSVRRIPSEDRRPIEDLTSKPRPNSEPALFFRFLVPTGHHRRGTRSTLLPSASTSHGDDEVYFFALDEPSRDLWHTARRRAFPEPPPA